ncbi:hypothetical protein CCR75_008933 [Bremia lactucae]|uniref:PHD-type domain-containing protein n=1 Tax=Bremia lactucae TaxID=4779 RepID=A0A976IM78_BRELC|nr:hypothetical protein CCR75_006692 [Bremia lactucae]TDH74376.1 hypothetical protein CCR75_008933 [Bremia lactucae]
MHLAALRDIVTLPLDAEDSYSSNQQNATAERKGEGSIYQDNSPSSPCPSSSSSSSEGRSTSSRSSSVSNANSGNFYSVASPPPTNNGSKNIGDDHKREKVDDHYVNGNKYDSSIENFADGSDQEEEERVLIDTEDEQEGAYDENDPTDEDFSSESDESSCLDGSYPRLPAAAVDSLIALRQRVAFKELQLNEKEKEEVIADARKRHQERRQAQRSKKKKSSQSKRRHKSASSQRRKKSTSFKRHHTNDAAKGKDVTEDEWVVDCSCGLNKKNYDDGTLMIQCDSCSHWVHAKCANKQPEAVAQEKFLCFRCGWIFDCECDIRRQPNHDDGHRMVECDSCKTWQHTMCVGIPMTEEPADDYQCPRCIMKGRQCEPASESGESRDRQLMRSRKGKRIGRRLSRNASLLDGRSAASSVEPTTISTQVKRRLTKRNKELTADKGKSLTQLSYSRPVSAAYSSSIPPPPVSPPPGLAQMLTRSPSYDRNRVHVEGRRSCTQGLQTTQFVDSHQRKRGRPMPNADITTTKTSGRVRIALSQSEVSPSLRGKGLMLQRYSSNPSVPSTPSGKVRPSRPLSSGTDQTHGSHGVSSRRRKGDSARDRLAKKLKVRRASSR